MAAWRNDDDEWSEGGLTPDLELSVRFVGCPRELFPLAAAQERPIPPHSSAGRKSLTGPSLDHHRRRRIPSFWALVLNSPINSHDKAWENGVGQSFFPGIGKQCAVEYGYQVRLLCLPAGDNWNNGLS